MSTTIDAINEQTRIPTSNPKSQLKVEDFINMMVTQLQNQDPMEPAKNEQLLSQMSQIGQLQSQQELTANQKLLTDSLKSMVQQNNIGAASNLIGKEVEGTGEKNADGTTSKVTGKVEGVSVLNGAVTLRLDSGEKIALENVTSVLNPDADLSEAVEKSAGAGIEK